MRDRKLLVTPADAFFVDRLGTDVHNCDLPHPTKYAEEIEDSLLRTVLHSVRIDGGDKENSAPSSSVHRAYRRRSSLQSRRSPFKRKSQPFREPSRPIERTEWVRV